MKTRAATRALSIYIVAAEESGDALGAALVRALKARHGGALTFNGVGGRAMAAAGIISPFAIDELSIIGIAAVPRRLPMIFRRIRADRRRRRRRAPGRAGDHRQSRFHPPGRPPRAPARAQNPDPRLRLALDLGVAAGPRPRHARLCRSGARHPAVRAGGRIVKLGGPPCLYVGHPLIERIAELRPNAEEAQRRSVDPPVVLVLPGSRRSEIRHLLGSFGAAIEQVAARSGPMELVLPTVPHLAAQVRAGVAGWAVAPRIVVEPAEKWAAFRRARAALAASGTVTLELALAGVPTVAAYRMSLARGDHRARLLRLRSDAAERHPCQSGPWRERHSGAFAVRCTPERLAEALLPLLADTPQRQRQIEAFGRLDAIMAIGGEAPSAKAAAIVLDVAQNHGRRDPAALSAASPPC